MKRKFICFTCQIKLYFFYFHYNLWAPVFYIVNLTKVNEIFHIFVINCVPPSFCMVKVKYLQLEYGKALLTPVNNALIILLSTSPFFTKAWNIILFPSFSFLFTREKMPHSKIFSVISKWNNQTMICYVSDFYFTAIKSCRLSEIYINHCTSLTVVNLVIDETTTTSSEEC